MTPTIFTDPRLPGLEILWWPEHGQFVTWLQVNHKRVCRHTYYREAQSMVEAEKVAKELFSGVLDHMCEGVAQDLGTYVPERKE